MNWPKVFLYLLIGMAGMNLMYLAPLLQLSGTVQLIQAICIEWYKLGGSWAANHMSDLIGTERGVLTHDQLLLLQDIVSIFTDL